MVHELQRKLVRDEPREPVARGSQFLRYEELVEFIRGWSSWSTTEYDYGGMVGLLGACLDNLREFALDAELDELGDRLEPEQADFLRLLAERLQIARLP